MKTSLHQISINLARHSLCSLQITTMKLLYVNEKPNLSFHPSKIEAQQRVPLPYSPLCREVSLLTFTANISLRSLLLQRGKNLTSSYALIIGFVWIQRLLSTGLRVMLTTAKTLSLALYSTQSPQGSKYHGLVYAT